MPRTTPLFCLLALLVAAAPPAAARRRAVHHPAVPVVAEFTEGGYADRISVEQGSSIRLHIATSVRPFTVRVTNLATDATMATITGLTSKAQNCTGRHTVGCGWEVTHTLEIPFSWPTGFYAATFPTALGTRHLFFTVRASRPSSPILVIAGTHTYQAYNSFGGRSLYDPDRVSKVSFDRPFRAHAGLGRFWNWERQFVRWMVSENRAFDAATDSDLEDATFLARYRTIVIVGHSEYWTSSARENLEAFSRNGGHIAILGGNTMWWQVRLEDDGRTLVGYKSAALDPAASTEPGTTTVNFYADPVKRPENSITGVSFRNGGYANTDADLNELPLDQRKGFLVTDAGHWIFENSGVSRGTEFGVTAVGAEVDGAIHTCDANGDIITDGSDGTPLNFEILAVGAGDVGRATLGFYVNSSGGGVFNAATQGWSNALAVDRVVRQVTRNVLDRFSTGKPFPYDAVTTPILTQDRFNCPLLGPRVLPAWRSGGTRGAQTARCAYEGAGGLELSGTSPIELARMLTPTGERLQHAEVRFYVNVDAYQNPNRLSLLSLRGRDDSTVVQPVLVQFIYEDNTRQVRLAYRDSRGSFFATPFVPLSPGWHLMELSWRSPGPVSLQIDGGQTLTLQNPDATQYVTEVFVDFPRPSLTESEFVCVDALAVATEKLGGLPRLVALPEH